MRFSFDQLDEFAVGCYWTEVVDGAWRAHRFPAGLARIYDSVPRFAARRDCASCVRLRFMTDSSRIGLRLRYVDSAHWVYQGAIVIDGGEPAAFGPRECVPEWIGTLCLGSHRLPRLVDLWLPHLCKVDVVSLELDDDAESAPAPHLTRWLAYGDSITQGFCASAPTSTGIARCALAEGAVVQNLAVGGSILYPELADHPPAGPCDLISIAYGVCDFQADVPLESFQASAQRLVKMLADTHPGRPILLITPINWNAAHRENTLGLSIQHYRDALGTLAGHWAGVHLVAGETLVRDDPAFFEDWVHPNDAGFSSYALNLRAHLQNAMTRCAVQSLAGRSS